MRNKQKEGVFIFLIHFKKPNKRKLRTVQIGFIREAIKPGPFGTMDPAGHASRIVRQSATGQNLLQSGYLEYGITDASNWR
jgi:hypothetical protein